MKKSFLKTFIVLGLLSIFLCGNFYTAQAQEVATPASLSSFAGLQAAGFKALSYLPGSLGWVGSAGTALGGTKVAETVTAPAVWAADKIAQGTIMPLIQTGAVFLLKIIQLVMYLTGKVFDMMLNITVIDQSMIQGLTGPTGSITLAWKLIRDIANLLIVFSLLYLGIKTILNGNGFAETKVLVSILIAAVVINFSLIFTRLVFETSNFIGSEIAKQITFDGQKGGYGGITSMSEGVMGLARPDLIMHSLMKNAFFSGWETMWGNVQVALITGITMLFIIVIFVGACWLLLYRYIVFILLMISSPVGLISGFIPWFKSAGDWWWKTLKNQAIVLPVFLLTFYVALLFVGPLSQKLSPAAFKGVQGAYAQSSIDTTVYAGAVEFFFYYALIIGFLLLPLIVPGKIAKGGSSLLTNAGNWATNKIKSLPRSSAQFGGRMVASGTARTARYAGGTLLSSTIGGNSEEKRKALQLQAQQEGWKGSYARQRLRTSEALKNQSYDIRNTKAGAKLGIGKGIESYNKAIETKKKKLEDRRKKDEKLFGLGSQQNSDLNRDNIDAAVKRRKGHEDVVTEREKKLEDAKASGDAAKIAEARKKLDASKKKLEEKELLVGKLKNLAELKSLELMQKRNARMWNTMSATQQAAAKKIEEEMVKKWKLAGQSDRKKNKRAAEARRDRDLSSPPGATPPPTPPTPPPTT